MDSEGKGLCFPSAMLQVEEGGKKNEKMKRYVLSEKLGGKRTVPEEEMEEDNRF